MDPYAVLADQYAKSTLPDLAHSALPNAPVQPYVSRRRRFRAAIAWFRMRKVRDVATLSPTAEDTSIPDLCAPEAARGW